MTRLQAGDEAALQALYERLGGKVFALACRMLSSREDAEEVVQDAFVKFYQNAARFDGERGSVRAFLYGIARNEALMRLRARRSRPRKLNLDLHAPGQPWVAAPSGDAVAGLSVQLALEQLEPADVELLKASFFRGYSHGELAEATGLPLGTVKSRLRRALLRLRDLLEEG